MTRPVDVRVSFYLCHNGAVRKGSRENELPTSGTKFFPANDDLDVCLVSFRVLRATRQEPSSNKFIYPFIISCEVAACAVGWIGGCIYRFSCPSAVERSRQCVAYVSSHHIRIEEQVKGPHGDKKETFIPGSEITPFFVGSLFLDERLEVELRVKLVRLCAGIGEDPLLVEVFGNLDTHYVRGELRRGKGCTIHQGSA